MDPEARWSNLGVALKRWELGQLELGRQLLEPARQASNRSQFEKTIAGRRPAADRSLPDKRQLAFLASPLDVREGPPFQHGTDEIQTPTSCVGLPSFETAQCVLALREGYPLVRLGAAAAWTADCPRGPVLADQGLIPDASRCPQVGGQAILE